VLLKKSIYRLGRTEWKGMKGQGILRLAPWEMLFLSTVNDLSISEAATPSVDSSIQAMNGEVKNL